MIMEKKLRFVNVMACSNLGTRIRLTLSSETDDLRDLISDALFKLSRYATRDEYFKVEHIYSVDSVVHSQESEI